jgi:hypothetical protein
MAAGCVSIHSALRYSGRVQQVLVGSELNRPRFTARYEPSIYCVHHTTHLDVRANLHPFAFCSVLRAHTSNFLLATRIFANFTHFSLVAADMLFVRPGYASFIVQFDGPSTHCCGSKKNICPEAAADPALVSAMRRTGALDATGAWRHSCPRNSLFSNAIDGLFYRRELFALVALFYPFTNSSDYPAEELFPANLLAHRLQRPCPRSVMHHVKYLGGTFSQLPQWFSRSRQNLETACVWQETPTPCFVLKTDGFHKADDQGAAYFQSLEGQLRPIGEHPSVAVRARAADQAAFPKVCESRTCRPVLSVLG